MDVIPPNARETPQHQFQPRISRRSSVDMSVIPHMIESQERRNWLIVAVIGTIGMIFSLGLAWLYTPYEYLSKRGMLPKFEITRIKEGLPDFQICEIPNPLTPALVLTIIVSPAPPRRNRPRRWRRARPGVTRAG